MEDEAQIEISQVKKPKRKKPEIVREPIDLAGGESVIKKNKDLDLIFDKNTPYPKVD